jgi:hypothetical protein
LIQINSWKKTRSYFALGPALQMAQAWSSYWASFAWAGSPAARETWPLTLGDSARPIPARAGEEVGQDGDEEDHDGDVDRFESTGRGVAHR